MNYLVTGGSGFIGSHLIEELLKKGAEIIKKFNLKQEEIREERRRKRKKYVISEETNEQ